MTAEQKKFYKKLGKLVKNSREIRGWKQEYLADRIGLGRTSVTNIEKGNQNISAYTFQKLLDCFEVRSDIHSNHIDSYLKQRYKIGYEEGYNSALKNIKKFITNTQRNKRGDSIEDNKRS